MEPPGLLHLTLGPAMVFWTGFAQSEGWRACHSQMWQLWTVWAWCSVAFALKNIILPFIPSPFIPMCSSHSEIWASRGKTLFLTNKSRVCVRENRSASVSDGRMWESERVVNGQCLTQRSSDKPLVTCVSLIARAAHSGCGPLMLMPVDRWF